MMPVEATYTSFARQENRSAVILVVRFTEACPARPVKAFAIPALMTRARARPLGKHTRHQSTGADDIEERVKTPATAVPGANSASTTSGRPLYRIPELPAANRTPATGRRAGKWEGAKGET